MTVVYFLTTKIFKPFVRMRPELPNSESFYALLSWTLRFYGYDLTDLSSHGHLPRHHEQITSNFQKIEHLR